MMFRKFSFYPLSYWIRYHQPLLLALVCAAALGGMSRYFWFAADTASYVAEVQQNLRLTLEKADNIMLELRKKAMEVPHDERFAAEMWKMRDEWAGAQDGLPTYVFYRQQPVFWNDHITDLTENDLYGFFSQKLIRTPAGIFLAKKTIQQDLEIVCVIPLRRKYALENAYLKPSLNPAIFPDNSATIIDTKTGNDLYADSREQNYLFSIEMPEVRGRFSVWQQWLLGLGSVTGILLFLWQLRKYIRTLLRHHRPNWALAVLALGLTGLRLMMLWWEIPYRFLDHPLFQPGVYASSWLAPSIADMLLNTLVVTTLALFVFRWYISLLQYRRWPRLPMWQRHALGVSLVVASFVALDALKGLMQTIYFDSKIVLDITADIDWGLAKLAGWLIFIQGAIGYFIVTHIAVKLMPQPRSSSEQKMIILYVLGGSAVYLVLATLLGTYDIVLFNLNIIYLGFISIASLPRVLAKADSSSFGYLFACTVVCALTGAYSMYNFDQFRDTENKNKYATQLLLENDLLAEFSLNAIALRAANDGTIKSNLVKNNPQTIISKIKNSYLTNYKYFGKYNIEISVYDYKGQPLTHDEGNYDSLLAILNNEKYKTDFPNVFFLHDWSTGIKRYFCHIPLYKDHVFIGAAVMDLHLRQIVPTSIYSRFFAQEGLESQYTKRNYSYAIYENRDLVHSSGDFSYDNRFLNLFQHEKGFLKSEAETDRHHHLRVPGLGEKELILSSTKYPVSSIFSNFSFMFLQLVFVVLMFVTANSFYMYPPTRKVSLTTRIQLYFNIAFFVPLVIVSGVTVSILNAANARETKSYYMEKAQSVAQDLVQQLSSYRNNFVTTDELQELIEQTSKLTQADINVYDDKGLLVTASQPFLFDNYLQSNYINPDAYSGMIVQRQMRMLLDERIGDLPFNTAYVSVKAPQTGELLGVVAIPFFTSQHKLDEQITDVLSTIMQVFALVFVVLLAMSLIAVKALTKPLRLITQRIRRTTLSGDNKPLEYHSDDEIGVLIGEYNRMLINLAENRAALARNEKEAAWREMAKQVAHEIKNPLTPMKLLLQQLQRVLAGEGQEHLAARYIRTLLAQIDTMSDIATSFSSFAQMPIPKDETFDIGQVLRQTIQLHSQQGVEITSELADGTYIVAGDSQFMGRIFTNLIINGLQSVPEGRKSNIQVKLNMRPHQRILIEIRDNGEGIPEHIQPRIFAPNFTTKAQGSGIGLAIAKRGVEHSGGTIWFETEIGRGTSFFIEIPLVSAEASATPMLEETIGIS